MPKYKLILKSQKQKETNDNTAIWRINCDGYYPYCSNCGFEPERLGTSKDNRTPFCPNCGERMKYEHSGKFIDI